MKRTFVWILTLVGLTITFIGGNPHLATPMQHTAIMRSISPHQTLADESNPPIGDTVQQNA
jgi:hypothetical protein